MLAAIREMAEKDECTKQTHVCAAEYLEACNLIFENGILSHEMICSPNSKALMNIREGMKWFFKWKEELQREPGKITLLGLEQAPWLCTNTTRCTCTCSKLFSMYMYMYMHVLIFNPL